MNIYGIFVVTANFIRYDVPSIRTDDGVIRLARRQNSKVAKLLHRREREIAVPVLSCHRASVYLICAGAAVFSDPSGLKVSLSG